MSKTYSPGFARDLLDLDAVGIVKHLQSQGHQTYFVGGCVRDLLLNRHPKDFDVATDARPEELKRIFGRRCRIIGRRFRLVHLHVGSQIYEIATFRGLPDDQELATDDSGFVVRANTFGTAFEDAKSRDFTVNGLFYDPIADVVIDYVGGIDDVRRRLLRTIGDADKRLREDPVRLLRAIKFAARLGFSLDAPILAAAEEAAPLIATCPPPRVAEELYRMAESGYSRLSFDLMHQLGVLDALVPEIARTFDRGSPDRQPTLEWLGELDRLAGAHGTLPREATFALMAWPFIENAIKTHPEPHRPSWGRFAMSSVRELAVRLSVPIRHRYSLAGMADQLKRLGQHPPRRPTPGQLRSYGVPLALTAQRMRFNLTGLGQEAYDLWATELERMGLWAAPFEPRADEDEPVFGLNAGDKVPQLEESLFAAQARSRGAAAPITQFHDRPGGNRPRQEKPKPATAAPQPPTRRPRPAADLAAAPAQPAPHTGEAGPLDGTNEERAKKRRRRRKKKSPAAEPA